MGHGRRVIVCVAGGAGEGGEGPNDNGAHQDDASHFFEEHFAAVPHVDQQGFQHGNAIRRQFHNEWGVRAAQECFAEQTTGDDSHDDAQEVDDEDDGTGPAAEKCPGQDDVDRQFGGTGHEGRYQDRQEAVLFAFEGAGGHDSRHIAAEPHQHRYEGFSMQPYEVHDFIHEKGATGHVAGVFEQGDTEKKNQDVRQKHDDTAHAGQNAVDEEILEKAFRKRLLQ